MKLRKRWALVGLAAVTAVMMGGCARVTENERPEAGESETVQENGVPEDSEKTEETEVKKPEKISWMVHSGLAEEDGTKQWVEEFERLTGIELDLRIVSNNEYYQMLELAFASGEVPDVFDVDAEHFAVYASQNAVADLTDLFTGADFFGEVDEELLNSVKLNGRYYGIPFETPGGTVTYVRKDWLNRLGMEVPGTYDEFLEMLRRFKEEIPECKVPITSAGLITPSYLPEFLQGANMNLVKVDGTWVDGMTEPDMVKALENLQAAYAEGLLDPEIVTNKTSNCRDQLYAGTVGVFNYWNGTWATRLTEGIRQNVPDAVLEPIPVIEGSKYLKNTTSVYCINGRLENEETASIFKYFIEYMNDGAEGQVLFSCGVEGVHWQQESDSIKMLPSLSNPEQTLTKAWRGADSLIVPFKDPRHNVKSSDLEEQTRELLREGGIPQYIVPVSRTLSRINSDLKLLKEEVMAKIVMGDESVEDGLKKYKDEAEMLGISQVIIELNESEK